MGVTHWADSVEAGLVVRRETLKEKPVKKKKKKKPPSFIISKMW